MPFTPGAESFSCNSGTSGAFRIPRSSLAACCRGALGGPDPDLKTGTADVRRFPERRGRWKPPKFRRRSLPAGGEECASAGFDGVDHGANGYLIEQFRSPINLRTDNMAVRFEPGRF
jgi:hypothetical protein